jgi:hypothetical protein
VSKWKLSKSPGLRRGADRAPDARGYLGGGAGAVGQRCRVRGAGVSVRMCPNTACEHHGQPTRLLGGCDCGTPLVPWVDPSEPTNEQLARLAFAFSISRSAQAAGVTPIDVEAATRLLDHSPALRTAWLGRHREVQGAIKGRAA